MPLVTKKVAPTNPMIVHHDLRAAFGPARDQDPRPTCMAFAGSDAHAGARQGWMPLSTEWAYYHALKRDGTKPHEGVTLATMLATLKGDGQPEEAAWPYIKSLSLNLAKWAPPNASATVYKINGASLTADIASLKTSIAAGTPALFTMSLSAAFYTPDAEGIVSSTEAINPKIRHAVIAVGHSTKGSAEYILVRNSWGANWGNAGYAFIDVAYLSPRLLAAAVLK